MPMTKPTSEQVTFLAAGSGASQRTVLDKLRDVVSVKDFGAVGDGVADDTAAFVAAYNSNAAVINIPAGAFKITATLVIDRPVAFVGANAQGDNVGAVSASSTRLVYTGTGEALRIVATGTGNGMSGVRVENLYLVGTASSDGGIRIGTVDYLLHSRFSNLYIAGFTNAGAGLGYGIKVEKCLGTMFENVYCRANKIGFHIYGVATSLYFASCWARSNSSYGWLIEQLLGSSFCQCLAEANGATGLCINARNGQNVSQLMFDAWYSELHNGAQNPRSILVTRTGTGTAQDISFYSPTLYDFFNPPTYTTPVIKFETCDNVYLENVTIQSFASGFAECTAGTQLCEIIGRGTTVDPANVTGNVYSTTSGTWAVQLTEAQSPDYAIGTWTPTLTSGGTLTSSGGKYQKIGNVVTVTGYLNFDASGVTATSVVVGGLTFGVGATSTNYQAFGSASDPTASTTMRFQRAESQTLRFNASATSAGATTVYFGATYFVAT